MPKQTGSIDLSSQKQAHDDASKTATNYIRADSTGIRIANSNPDNAITYQHQTANDTEFIVGGVSRALISGNGARFGKAYVSGAQDNESHMELDYHSLQMIDKEGDPYLYISDLRDRSGTVNIVDTFYGDGSLTSFNLNYQATNTSYTVSVSDDSGGTVTKSSTNILFADAPTKGAIITVTYATASQQVKAFTFGTRQTNSFIGGYSFSAGYNNIASGLYSHAEGNGTTASGPSSHAEGYGTNASRYYSHAEGMGTTASGNYSHTEGYGTTASEPSSHAEGCLTTASGSYSHAEGYSTTSSGYQSHAEGYNTNATNWGAHAEGYSTTASGSGSHAQNYGTIASSNNQTAIGRWNIQDDSNSFAFIIGNGSNANNRSNALTVDWNGTVNLQSNTLANTGTGYCVLGTNIKTSDETNDTSANLWGTALEIRDHGDNQRSYLRHFETTGNHQGIQLETRRYINNAWVYNGLRLSVDGSGNIAVALASGTPWRNAIFGVTTGIVPASLGGTGHTNLQAVRNSMGLGNTTGALPIANGGTGQSATTNSNISLSSGVSASNYIARKWGNVVTIFLYNVEFTAAVANGSSHDIGTVASGYRPAYLCYAQVASSNLSGLAYVRCTTAGALNFTNRSGAQLAASKTFSATITYVIG